MKPTEQNKQTDGQIEEPAAYEITKIVGSNSLTFEQESDQDVYVIETLDVSNVFKIETPNTSNVYEIAKRADPNVYEIEDPRLLAKLNLPTAQSIAKDPEQNNTYSSLQSSSGVMESNYSRLKR